MYQEAYRLALEVHQLTLGFPVIERFVLAEQIRRASKSIPANIAEGWGVQTGRNFAHFLGQALGSTDEMSVHLDFAKDLGYISPARHADLLDRYTVLGKRLYRLMERHRESGVRIP